MDTREAVARAICAADYPNLQGEGETLSEIVDEEWTLYEPIAATAIAAHLKALADAGLRERIIKIIADTDQPNDDYGIAEALEGGFSWLSEEDAHLMIAAAADGVIAALRQPVADHPADQRRGE